MKIRDDSCLKVKKLLDTDRQTDRHRDISDYPDQNVQRIVSQNAVCLGHISSVMNQNIFIFVALFDRNSLIVLKKGKINQNLKQSF